MASIRRHGAKWRAQVDRRGVRRSKVLPTRQAAKDWGARQEYLIDQERGEAVTGTLADLLRRYAREVSQLRRGARWEQLRLEKWAASDLGATRLRDLTAATISDWRDARLRSVAPGTVIREMGLLGAVLETARRDWAMIPANPARGVRRPPRPAPRQRLPTPGEIKRMGHVAGDDLSTATARAWHAFRFACETAMRAGEIVGLRPGDISGAVAHLPMTKSGRPRDVPLSSAALALLAELPPADPVFGITSRDLDALFRKIRSKAGVTGLTFHDSRAYAITQLARRLDPLDLARMVGHRDLRMLIDVYYRESAADIAARL